LEEALERLRIKLVEPICINSACQSPTHNAKARGYPRRLHLIVIGHWGPLGATGGSWAVDVAATNGLNFVPKTGRFSY